MNVIVLAAGTSSDDTIRGMMAPGAEDATAKKADWTPTSARITGTLFSCATVWPSSARVIARVPIELME